MCLRVYIGYKKKIFSEIWQVREREDGKEKEKDRKGSGFGERLKQTYSFTTKSVFFCRQPYSNHKLAFSALLREQHVCLGEKNGIKYPVHVSTLALFVLTEGLVKRTVYCTLLLNLLAQQTIIQHFLYNVEHVLMMLFTH